MKVVRNDCLGSIHILDVGTPSSSQLTALQFKISTRNIKGATELLVNLRHVLAERLHFFLIFGTLGHLLLLFILGTIFQDESIQVLRDRQFTIVHIIHFLFPTTRLILSAPFLWAFLLPMAQLFANKASGLCLDGLNLSLDVSSDIPLLRQRLIPTANLAILHSALDVLVRLDFKDFLGIVVASLFLDLLCNALPHLKHFIMALHTLGLK